MIGADPLPAAGAPKSAPGRDRPAAKNGLAQSTKKIKIHTVKSGETLGVISRTYYGDPKKVALIAEFNDIKDFDQIHIGQKIKIPLLEPEKPEKAPALKEAELSEAEKSTTGLIEETDMNKGGLLGKPILMLMIMICLIGTFIFLLFKLKGLKGPVDKIRIEEGGPFTMGEVDPGQKKTKARHYMRKS